MTHHIRVESTGQKVEAAQHHHQPMPPPKAGEHLWIVAAVWRVNPETVLSGKGFLLDTENMLNIEGPGCFHCEKHFTKELAAQPCEGDPK